MLRWKRPPAGTRKPGSRDRRRLPPVSPGRARRRERFDVELFGKMFDPAFNFFKRELESRMDNFFVSRGGLRLFNETEVKAFERDVAGAFVEELWLRHAEAKPRHRKAFLEGALLFAEILGEIGIEKIQERIRGLGAWAALQGERVQTARITGRTFAASRRAMETEIIDELERMQEKKKKRKKRK